MAFRLVPAGDLEPPQGCRSTEALSLGKIVVCHPPPSATTGLGFAAALGFALRQPWQVAGSPGTSRHRRNGNAPPIESENTRREGLDGDSRSPFSSNLRPMPLTVTTAFIGSVVLVGFRTGATNRLLDLSLSLAHRRGECPREVFRFCNMRRPGEMSGQPYRRAHEG
jgi:hypothetical protein